MKGGAKSPAQEVTVTVRDLRESILSLAMVGGMTWQKPDARFRFARLIRMVNLEADAFGPVINELMAKYGEFDGAGRMRFRDFKAQRKFDEEAKPLLAQTVRLEFAPFDRADFPETASPAALAALWWCIKDEAP